MKRYTLHFSTLGLVSCILVLAFGIFWVLSTREFQSHDTPMAAVAEASEEIPVPAPTFPYIEIVGSCGPHFEGDCVVARAGPGNEFASVSRLRNGVVLKTSDEIETDGHVWYKVSFDEDIRYPERVARTWWVAGEYARPFLDTGEEALVAGESASSTKHIIVDRGSQMLYAYDGDTLFMETKVSTGLEMTPTPRGTFTVFKKTPTRYMQGPLPGISDQYYDLPGVPWDLYFTSEGATIHGAYWHNEFGERWSHGCVNLPLQEAQKLYQWADLGTLVIVRD